MEHSTETNKKQQSLLVFTPLFQSSAAVRSKRTRNSLDDFTLLLLPTLPLPLQLSGCLLSYLVSSLNRSLLLRSPWGQIPCYPATLTRVKHILCIQNLKRFLPGPCSSLLPTFSKKCFSNPADKQTHQQTNWTENNLPVRGHDKSIACLQLY